ncbi:hypothetical protein SNE40_009560 [Patella caerulea]|uniref:Reverse transcriptase n=1 Tax=Patella caerulea TaxID=87958 RepID=A0AAN8JVQ5_PATCE
MAVLTLPKPKSLQKTVSYRKLRDINLTNLKSDILNDGALNKIGNFCDISDQLQIYNTELQNIIDSHPPIVRKTLTIRPNRKWYNDSVRESKQARRKAEKVWRKSKLEIDRQIYVKARNDTNILINQTKQTFVLNRIQENNKNPKELNKIFNTMIKTSDSTVLPEHRDPKLLAESFSQFFNNKIVTIRRALDNFSLSVSDNDIDVNFTGSPLSTFPIAAVDEIKSIISTSSSSSCELDVFPTHLVKSCSTELCPILCSIVNTSLSTGNFPDVLKEALVFPLLKKSTLDHMS